MAPLLILNPFGPVRLDLFQRFLAGMHSSLFSSFSARIHSTVFLNSAGLFTAELHRYVLFRTVMLIFEQLFFHKFFSIIQTLPLLQHFLSSMTCRWTNWM